MGQKSPKLLAIFLILIVVIIVSGCQNDNNIKEVHIVEFGRTKVLSHKDLQHEIIDILENLQKVDTISQKAEEYATIIVIYTNGNKESFIVYTNVLVNDGFVLNTNTNKSYILTDYQFKIIKEIGN